jgi:hypothetical protein
MNLEDRLSEALHTSLDGRAPSPELGDRVVEAVAAPRPARRPLRLAVAIALVGVSLVLALVPIAMYAQSEREPGGGPSAAGATPSAVSPGVPAHFDRDGLAFDYPAGWHVSVSGLNMHYVTILDFVGTGSGSGYCRGITPGPSDTFLSGTECGVNFGIQPGQVVVEISRSDGPPRAGPIDPTDPSQLDSSVSQRFVTVGGLPAIFSDYAPGDVAGTMSATWQLSVPEQLISRYFVRAIMKGPGLEELQAQVAALVASIEYDPAAPVLDPADGPALAARGLAQVRADDPAAYSCFSEPGATGTATITSFPGYSALQKPLPVTCSLAIEPNVIGLWKMSLTWSWTAAADRSAGELTEIIWLDSAGTLGLTGYGPGPSEIPYWP